MALTVTDAFAFAAVAAFAFVLSFVCDAVNANPVFVLLAISVLLAVSVLLVLVTLETTPISRSWIF